ncbi:hypothetical protein MR818_00815 [bacterium]|nr:hypothetical protein [bacterium]
MSADNRRKPDERKQNNPEKLSVEELHVRIAEDKKKAVRSLFMALSALVVMVGFCIAWFASNHRVNATGMNIEAANAQDFQLASKGKRQEAEQKYLKNEDSQNILNNGTAYLINSDGKMIDASDDTDNTATYYVGFTNLAWRLDDDVTLMPGTSGSMTFYIIPRKENLTSANLTFTLKAYEDDTKTGVAAVSKDNQLQNLVMGHILFFRNRDADGSYAGWIAPDENGSYLTGNSEYSFTVTPENKTTFEKDKPYPVTLYWIWPNYIRNYIYTNQNGSLFTNPDSSDYKNLLKFLNKENFQNNEAEQKYSKIFYVKPDSGATSAKDSTGGNGNQINSNITDAVLNECNEAYNNADQYIGENARYLYVDVTVDMLEKSN